MGVEIERKFLVAGSGWRQGAEATEIRQGYLSLRPHHTVRVRVAGGRAWITIKGLPEGARRAEFEYEIPLLDGRAMLQELCERPLVEKTRYRVRHGARLWEIDEFGGANAGLCIAEIEIEDEREELDLPAWVGAEVTDEPRYANANLVRAPFCTWPERR